LTMFLAMETPLVLWDPPPSYCAASLTMAASSSYPHRRRRSQGPGCDGVDWRATADALFWDVLLELLLRPRATAATPSGSILTPPPLPRCAPQRQFYVRMNERN
jgi:hypothetical protein